MNNVTLTTTSYQFILVPHSWQDRRAPKTVRVYAPSVEPEMEMPPFGRKGENADNDKAWRDYNREELRLMREELELALKEAKAEAAVRDEGVWAPVIEALEMKLRFSRKAGCSCPCSPGFIGTHRVYLSGAGALDQISVGRRPAPEPEAPARTFTMADFVLMGNNN